MTIRSGMVSGAYHMVAKAATIAVRYLCVRKQGFADTQAEDPFASGELAVIDYQLHQYRMMKAVSTAYLFKWSTKYVGDFLNKVKGGVMNGDESAADGLPELHA